MKHFFFFLLCIFSSKLHAQPGELDPAFGTNGLVLLNNGGHAQARASMTAVTGDGKILVGGEAFTGLLSPFMLARFQADGSPDIDFGQNGIAIHAKFDGRKIVALPDGKILILLATGFGVARLNVDGSEDTTFKSDPLPGDEDGKTTSTDMCVQADGKILVCGWYFLPPFNRLCVARFFADGSLDTDFGNNGLASVDTIPLSLSYIVAVQPDGKIVVAGSQTVNFEGKLILGRFLPDGNLDPGFGNGGLTLIENLGENAIARALAFQPDGKILAAAHVGAGLPDSIVLFRTNTNGVLDGAFGQNGISSSKNLSTAHSLVLLPDGKMLVGGLLNATIDRASVLRFLPNGALDNTYSGPASLAVWQTTYTLPFGLALQTDNKPVIAFPVRNGTSWSFQATRLLENGQADQNFGNTGVVESSFDGGDDAASDVTILPDGKVLAIGDTYDNGIARTMIARFNPDGTPDPTFGAGGKTLFALTSGSNYAWNMVIQPDGKIVALLNTTSGNSLALWVVRFTASGILDVTFGSGGQFLLPGFYQNVAKIALQPDGKIIVATTKIDALQESHYVVLRLTQAGQLDASFGASGIKDIYFGSINTFCTTLAVQPDGKIVISGRWGGGYVMIVRLTSAGQMDPEFGTSVPGKSLLQLGASSGEIYAIVIQQDGKIIIGGNDADLIMFMRVYADGSSPDAGFGDDGIARFMIGAGKAQCNAIVLQPDGKIIGAGNTTASTSRHFLLTRLHPNGIPDSTFHDDGFVESDFGYGFDVPVAVKLQPDGKIVAAGGVLRATDLDLGIARYQGAPLVHVQESANKFSFSILPNPASDFIEIKPCEDMHSSVRVSLYDSNGHQVRSTVFESNLRWDIKDLPAGVYWVQIQGVIGSRMRKFVKF